MHSLRHSKDHRFSANELADLEQSICQLDNSTSIHQQMREMLDFESKKEIVCAIYVLYDTYCRAITSLDMRQLYAMQRVIGGLAGQSPELNELERCFKPIVSFFHTISPHVKNRLSCFPEDDVYEKTEEVLNNFMNNHLILNELSLHMRNLVKKQKQSFKYKLMCLKLLMCILLVASAQLLVPRYKSKREKFGAEYSDFFYLLCFLPLFLPLFDLLSIKKRYFSKADNHLKAMSILRGAAYRFLTEKGDKLRLLGNSAEYLRHFVNFADDQPQTLYELAHKSLSNSDFSEKISSSVIKTELENFAKRYNDELRDKTFPTNDFLHINVANLPLIAHVDWSDPGNADENSLHETVADQAPYNMTSIIEKIGVFRVAVIPQNDIEQSDFRKNHLLPPMHETSEDSYVGFCPDPP